MQTEPGKMTNLDGLRVEGDINLSPHRQAWQEKHLSPATHALLAEDSRWFLHQAMSTPCLNALRSANGAWIEDGEGRRYIFTGIAKCLFDRTAFDSTPEKTLAVIMEDDMTVLKWLRPPHDQLPIFYGGKPYNVDFVTETDAMKFLLEVKERKAIYEGDVLAKAKAAIKWCEAATKADKQKPWEYKLIPEDAVKRTNDFKFTIAQAMKVM